MATLTKVETMGDVLKKLGGIPAERVRIFPVPGSATEHELILANDREAPLCELIDGTLVEKTMGQVESRLAIALASFLFIFVSKHKLGAVYGADGPSRLSPDQVRLPDIWFVTSERLRQCNDRKAPILDLAPDLAVEILSKGNSRGEMQRKLRDYFKAGTRLVWYIDPKKRIVRVYTDPDNVTRLTENQTLEGSDVLAGFTLCLSDLFAELDD